MPSPDTGHAPTGALAPLAIGALGVVFGDIGTSPLYTFREAFHGAGEVMANPDHVFGILSLIFWTITIIVSFKYALLILRADNQGQGGLLALIGLAIQSASKPGRREKFLALGIVGAALLIALFVLLLSNRRSSRIRAELALEAWPSPRSSQGRLGRCWRSCSCWRRKAPSSARS
ncbi:MAG: KUP/HAK/KT family potassium transporter [Rhodospirillaceae bacterium]|nr:KUP/HAK/KT family potassium transporter [Rhodospirillaceae bacterium]